jgi:uncharacterized membrane protein
MSFESTPGYPPGVGLNPEPTKDEKLLAMLAHLLAFFGGGFIAPIVILAVKRDSKFVAFHAIQALLITCAWIGVFMVTFFGTVSLAILRAPHPALGAHPARPPAEIFLMFPIFFLGFGGWMVTAVVLALRANDGRWSAVPGIGWLARRLADLV